MHLVNISLFCTFAFWLTNCLPSFGYEIPTLQLFDVTSLSNSSEERCLYDCADQEPFQDCMSNCWPSWIFQIGNCDDFPSHAEDHSPVPCNPSDRTIQVHEFRKRLSDGRVQSYLYMTWKPCVSGLELLRAYKVILGDDYGEVCNGLRLTRNLTDQNKNIRGITYKVWGISLSPEVVLISIKPISNRISLSPRRSFHQGVGALGDPRTFSLSNDKMQFAFVAPIDYGMHYFMFLHAFPYVEGMGDPPYKDFVSSSCPDLNGARSCFCTCDNLGIPNITVAGYDVDASVPAAKECFNPLSYRFVILCEGKDGSVCPQTPKSVEIPFQKNQSIVTHHLSNLYNSAKYFFSIEVKINYAGEKFCERVAQAAFDVKAWIPPRPNVTVHSFGRVTVQFMLPANFNIERFNLSLSEYPADDEKLRQNTFISSDILEAQDAENGILTKEYPRLSTGNYAVQIREVRVDSIIFSPTQWGPYSTFFVEPELNTAIIASVLAAVILVCFILLSFYCVKKGVFQQLCLVYGKVRKSSSNPDFPPQDPIQSIQQKVLIIWQADYRCKELERAQELVIKRFSFFLTHICGIHVTVDIFEQNDLSKRYGQWIDEARKNVDWIVFVCPHFDYTKQDQDQQSRVGNFNLAFNYLEAQLHSKAIAVAFEHASFNLTKETKFLRRVASGSYQLMDNIDGFYFHTQGFSKTWYFVWLLHRYISFRGYVKTNEGRELDMSLKDLKEKLDLFNAKPDRLKDLSVDISPSGGYNADNEPSSDSNSPSPTIVPSVFDFPPDSLSLISRQRVQCESMASLVENPAAAKEAIKQINRQSSLSEARSYYPIQNSADRSEEERERLCPPYVSRHFSVVDESCFFHNHGFGEACMRCNDDVTSSVRHSSESNDETMPKSPDVLEMALEEQIDSYRDSGVEFGSTIV